MRQITSPLLLLILIVMPRYAAAGANAQATAHLSWTPDSAVVHMDAVPADSFYLYLELDSLVDVHALAVDIRWFPAEQSSACFQVAPATGGTACSGTSGELEDGPFAGEPTVGWYGISPAPSATQACVRWLVAAGSCAESPAIFTAVARVQDSNGSLDTLQAAEPVTIGAAEVLQAESLTPSLIAPSTPTMVRIGGSGFLPGSEVTISNGTVTQTTDNVIALSPTELVATISAAPSADPYQLTVSLPSGLSALAGTSLMVVQDASSFGLRPTNADTAFHSIDLYANRLASANCSLHWPGPYPSTLTSSALLVPRASMSDTMGVFKSTPSDAILIGSGIGYDFTIGQYLYPCYVDYAISPPRLATSICAFIMGEEYWITPFNNFGAHAMAITAYYTNGDSARTELAVGKQVRGYRDYSLACNGTPLLPYTTAPTDTLAANLYASGGYYYDAYEVRLPEAKRAARIDRVRVSPVPLATNLASCNFPGSASNPYSFGHGFLAGLGVWPQFKVGAPSDTVVYQTQHYDLQFGGYVTASGDTVGTRRTYRANACQPTCVAMQLTFNGVTCSPIDMNNYLRGHKGYTRETVAVIRSVSVTGDTLDFVGDACSSADWKIGHTFLVERGAYSPLATVEIIYKPDDCKHNLAKGRVLRHHVPTRIAPSDTGYTYRYLIPQVAGRGFSSNRFALKDTKNTAAAVESLLVRGVPVELSTHSMSGGSHHVIADGWMPAFVSGSEASGTYSIKDPAYGKVRLIQKPFKNEFRNPRVLVPVAQQAVNADAGAKTAEEDDETGLTLLIDGAADVEIFDPQGRRLFIDQGTSIFAGDLDPAYAVHGWQDDDDEENQANNDYSGQDIVQIPQASEGAYLVRVSGSGSADVTITANATGTDGMRGCVAAIDTVLGEGSIVYRLSYAASGAMQLDRLGITAVNDGPRPRRELRVVTNPANGVVEFVLPEVGVAEALEVFDLLGRRVASIHPAAGAERVMWAGKRDGRGAGVYFARFGRGATVRVVRFVLL